MVPLSELLKPMTRILFLLTLALGLFRAAGQDASPSPLAAPSAAASPTPTREMLASAPAGYLDLPQKSKFGFSSVRVDGPYIAMTFDDGPHVTNTPRLLDMVKQRHIKLTFFELGERITQDPEILKRIVAEGHELGNHSWSHPDFARMSDTAVRSELQRTQEAFQEAVGFKPTLMRPPYGAITKAQRDWIHREFGFKIILWDVDPLDWKRPGPDVVARRIISGARPGSIILSHDIHKPTIDAMPQVFDTLLAKGFKFVTVSELLAMDKGPLPVKPKKGAAALPSASPSAANTPQ